MIPFFRRIHKKMAYDNKPLKYLKYAIGEIILVVIGILIAFYNAGFKHLILAKPLEILHPEE